MNFVVIGRVIKGCVRGWGVEKIMGFTAFGLKPLDF